MVQRLLFMINKPFVVFLNTNGVFFLIGIALVYLWFVRREKNEVFRVLASVLVASVVALTIKELFEVPRPFMIGPTEAMAGLTQLSSFPSMHTAIAFSVATTVSFRGRRFGILLFLVAGLIAFGRILANVHYPVDIFFGIIIGVTISHFIENTSIKNKIVRKVR